MNKLYLSNHISHIFESFAAIHRLLLIPLTSAMWRVIQEFREVRLFTSFGSIVSSGQVLVNSIAFTANILPICLFITQVLHRLVTSFKQWKVHQFQQNFIAKSYEIISALPVKHSHTQKGLSLYYTVIQELRIFLFHYRLKLWASSSHQSPTAPNCCTLEILAEPPPGQPIRADIVFIHGLHGSLGNTWRQGLWDKYREPEQFERSSQPPIRPPKRARHSRNATSRPPQKPKKPRYSFKNNRLQCAIDSYTDSTDEFDDNLSKYTNVNFIDYDNRNSQRFNGTTLFKNSSRLHLDPKQKANTVQSDIVEYYKYDNDLNNHRKPTYHNSNYAKCWPADWLPLDCPGVRVIAINYTTDPHLWRPLWKKKEPRTNLTQRAREMTELLLKYHVGFGHPIVYVGHSKGGLFVKQIIVDAWESGCLSSAPLWRSARGVFFYSVPHKGSNLASIKAPLATRSVELVDIEKDNKYLLDLHRRFVGLYHVGFLNMEVFSFIETALTFMSFLYLRIVGVDSADPGIGDVCAIRLDHREICKPRSRNCILYKELVRMIKKVS